MDTAIARPELLLVADAVAREKNIDREEVLEAMEQAIQKAGRAKYGHEKDIRATIDRKTGDVRLSRWTEIVETVENEETQMPGPRSRAKLFPDKAVGEFVVDPLPPIDFGRIAAQTAKQVIVQRVREYERKRQYEEFKDRVGEIINGVVKRTEYGNLMVELGRAEALLRRDELIARESFRNGDRVRAYIYDVREEPRGPQIFLSRTHPGFLAKLFAQEVPEIYDGIIEIKAVSRDPGQPRQDGGDQPRLARSIRSAPASVCAARRVQAVVQELQGEKIDIIPWSPQAATFVVNALAPAEVTKVVLDEEAGRVEVVVPDEQLQPRHRPPRPERAARLAADPLGHRHPDRGRGKRAPPGRIPPPLRPVRRSAGRRRHDRRPAGDRRLHHGRGTRLHARWRKSPRSRASTTASPRN